MPVVEVTQGMPVQPDHVYVIPPNQYLTIAGGALHLTGPIEPHGAPTTIDRFLRSLAEDRGAKAVGVLLSGTGSYGTLGLAAVRGSGGMTLVQDPATAECGDMPRHAIAAGLADGVLPVEQLPGALARYARHFYVNGDPPAKAEGEADGHLTRILAEVLAQTGADFRPYRKKVVRRRIERRMGLRQVGRLAEYLAFLRDHPEETHQLARDLLIGVTAFFRDPEAWKVRETQVLAPLVAGKEAGAPLRAWVPGCATGEEAYSLAMLLLEQLAAAPKDCRLQVFATDVNEGALAFARRGLYPASIAADVTPERLARFFTRAEGHSYQVSRQLREAITFGAQNLLSDAPLSKLDLISCRNVLIYLEPEAQQRVLALFHSALNEGGYLLLGPAETVNRQPGLFEPISRR
jgi:two-component system CheB/CheR fusion protein